MAKVEKKEARTIKLNAINPKIISVKIEGDTDLVLNKLNANRIDEIIRNDSGEADPIEKPDEWRGIITALHWEKGTPEKYSEKELMRNLNPKVNRPCISAFGMRKSWGDAVVRNEIDTYKTSFMAGVNIINANGLIPVDFTGYTLNVTPIALPKQGHTIAKLHTFSGWSAEVIVSVLETAYTVDQVVNIINLAGFGGGIGSGRSTGYGRYHVADIQQV